MRFLLPTLLLAALLLVPAACSEVRTGEEGAGSPAAGDGSGAETAVPRPPGDPSRGSDGETRAPGGQAAEGEGGRDPETTETPTPGGGPGTSAGAGAGAGKPEPGVTPGADPGADPSAAEPVPSPPLDRPSAPSEETPAAEGPALPAATDAPPSPQPPTRLSDHRLAYLEESGRQMRRLERAIGAIGAERWGSGALAAAALAAHGRDGWSAKAVEWTGAALDECTGRWDRLECELALLSLQRVALQFPEVLPPPLRRRLREQAATPAPPPGPELLRDPWAFRRTENQQMAVTARSLGAHAVAGSGDSPAGRTWSRFAEAFLVAHDRDGWYEADSPGYMATSVTALLHLRDHAPTPRVRTLAERQLHLLFARWAENQVDGTPAGPRSRTYVHWAQGTRNTPWRAWAWYAAGLGDPRSLALGDWPQIATAGYEFPDAVAELLRSGRAGGPYEVRGRRRISMAHRMDLDTATYSWVTPDYVLSAAPAVDGLALAVSGGQEIQVTLFADGPEFSPLYLWSRVHEPRSQRWRSRAGQEKGVAWRNLAAARMGTREEPGHAWLAAPWSRPEAVSGEVLVSRSGATFVALVAAGGWEVAPAAEAFPRYYGDKASRGSWVAIPKRQPAEIGLEVARAAELGGEGEPWATWRRRAKGLALEVAEGALTVRSTAGQRLRFVPGAAAAVDGTDLRPAAWPLHTSPHLEHRGDGAWTFRGAGARYELAPLEPRR